LFADALALALAAAEFTDGDVDPTCGQSLVRLGYDRDFAEAREHTGPLRRPPSLRAAGAASTSTGTGGR
jgi:FAD:protein FMN transferase